MDKKSIINAAIFFLLLITPTPEALFFGYPKKSLLDIFHSIKDKKENLKKNFHREDVHHYHLHYYPLPVKVIYDHSILKPPFIAPGKEELDHIHREELSSLGWTSNEYKHIPGPKIIATLHHSRRHLDHRFVKNHDDNNVRYPDPINSLPGEGLTLEDQFDLAAIRYQFDNHHRLHPLEQRHNYHHYYYPSEISFDLPLNREIVIKNDENKKKKKSLIHNHFNPVIDFFQKLHDGIKNSIFHYSEDDYNNDDDHEDQKSILTHRDDKIDHREAVDQTVAPDSYIGTNIATNPYAVFNLDREKLWKLKV